MKKDLTTKKVKNRSIWYFEDVLYLCWAWDKDAIKKDEISASVGKTIPRCREKIEDLKNKNLFDLYKKKFETGDFVGSGMQGSLNG